MLGDVEGMTMHHDSCGAHTSEFDIERVRGCHTSIVVYYLGTRNIVLIHIGFRDCTGNFRNVGRDLVSSMIGSLPCSITTDYQPFGDVLWPRLGWWNIAMIL